MPWHHTNGVNNQLIAPLFAGASVVLIDRFHAADIPAQLEEFAPTILTGVPTMYARILDHLGDQPARTALRMLRCGSAPLNTALQTQIEEAFQMPLIVSYGLSEATCTSAMNPPSARRIGSVGTALRGQELRLFVPESTELSRPGTEGEIGIGGACVMRGYRNQAIDSPVAQGWLRTGDIGRLDDDGYLYVTGRLGEAILRGGENLSPQLIEDALSRHPSVAACCVVGAPHADLGETPVAFVRLHRPPPPSAGELRDLVTQHLSRSYAPGDIRFVDELPENSVGKVDRRALRQILASATEDTRTST
jgi:acyl-CoA synthetase (AMP-forming)/AMP-acid ligase II